MTEFRRDPQSGSHPPFGPYDRALLMTIDLKPPDVKL